MQPIIRHFRLCVLVLATWTSTFAAQAFGGARVLCLGDSLTEGLGVAKEAAWPALAETELKSAGAKDVTLINAGVSGSTTASGLGRLKWHLKGAAKPDILLLALGANDGLRGLDLKLTRTHLVEVIELAKANGIKVLLAGMQIPPNYGKDYTEQFKKLFPEVAAAEKIELIPFLLVGVAAEKGLNQADGIHPNEAGHKMVAKTVVKALKPLLPR